MYTRCTHCDTWFAIGADHLRQGRGEVRCGSCMRSFDALVNLYDALPEGLSLWPDDDDPADLAVTLPSKSGPGGPQPGAVEHPDDVEAPSAAPLPPMAKLGPSIGDIGTLTLGDDARSPSAPAAGGATPPGRRATTPAPLGATDPGDLADPGDRGDPRERGGVSGFRDPVDLDRPTGAAHAPSAPPAPGGIEARWSSRSAHPGLPRVLRDDLDRLGRARTARRHGWIYASASMLLVLVLVGQYAWFLPGDLVKRYPSARPWLQSFCAVTGCTLPTVRQPSLVRLASRDVRIHPNYEGALLVSAALVNAAAFAQPFPTLVFTLFNVNGQTIASRAFAPSDYLETEPPAEGMPPHLPVQIVLELLAPEEAAVSFEFRFI